MAVCSHNHSTLYLKEHLTLDNSLLYAECNPVTTTTDTDIVDITLKLKFMKLEWSY